MTEVFSSGGGTQSSAISVLIIQGRLPKPDIVVIADTGMEKSTTWQYMDKYVSPALSEIGLKVHRVSQEWATVGLLSKNEKSVLMPMFSSQVVGATSKLDGFCSNEWKLRPIQRYLREALGISTSDQKRWIGFSLDESRRAIRMMAGEDYKEGRIRFPLIHDLPMRRHQAIQIVRDFGWPEPPRSACFMCPNMSDDEWRDITPLELREAAILEKKLQETDPHVWLHKSCQPIETINFNEEDPQGDLFERACSSGVCFV